MASIDALHKPTWDKDRLGYLAKPLELHGDKISKDVIQDIGPMLAKCVELTNLTSRLYQRRLITDKDYRNLQQPTADGNMLNSSLVNASCEGLGRGKQLVKYLYLALLDAYLDNCDQYCHHVALKVLRIAAVKHLRRYVPELPTEQPKDLQSVVAKFEDVVDLNREASLELRQNLNLLSSRSESTSLKGILVEYSTKCTDADVGLIDLVTAMMLTQGVGRYVTKLLPFYQSYPVELLIFLEGQLGEKWENFAWFLGFTRDETDDIKSDSYGNAKQEIQNFLKVWRMPDLQQKFNDDILYRVCQKAGIKLDTHIPPLNRAVSDPRPYSIPRQKKRTGSGHGYKPGPGQLGLYSPGSRRACMNGSSEHYSTDSGIVQSSGGYNDDDDDNTSEASSLPYSRQPSYSTVPEERESSPSSPYYPTSSQSNSSHSSISPHKHPLSSSTTASYPASPHPTSSEPKEQTRTKQSHQEQIVTARLGKLNLYSNQSSVSESSDSFQPQLLEPNAQVSLPSGSSKSLGMGLYGEVLEVVYKGHHYAAKEYRKDFICGDELKKISEKLLNLKLKHENIVIYCGVADIRGTDRSVLVMEKVDQNLETVLEDRTRELQSATKISILSNIADGLDYLHSFGIIHCNLIPTNILLTRELKAKISDYGNALVRPIATTVTEGRQDTAVLNDYLPQEALDGGPCNEPSLDTFSFGHLSLYVILQQKPHPLKGYFFKQNGKRVARSEVERREDYLNQMKKNISGGLLEPLLEWIKQCLDDDPSLRPQLRKFNFSTNFISN